MNDKITPVILCGGSGTRLWPRSRRDKPKPFLPLLGDRTLFEQTLDRCGDTASFAPPMVVAGEAHVEYIIAQAPDDVTLIVEPAAQNTAPAIALAAALLPPDALMLVCPSDHHIADARAFADAAVKAATLAREDWMVAFGIAADRPETGFGYIRRGAPTGDGFRVDRFVEKPDRSTAEAFLAEGGYDWNGGIFAFRAGAFLAELEAHRPEMAALVREAVAGAKTDDRVVRPDPAPFAAVSGESVDYAVMENTGRAAVVPAAMGWSDVGNWAALRDARAGDEAGNRVSGDAELVDCRNVLVETDGPRVSAIGLDDVVIVVDGNEVLVTTIDGAQKVGKLQGVSA